MILLVIKLLRKVSNTLQQNTPETVTNDRKNIGLDREIPSER